MSDCVLVLILKKKNIYFFHLFSENSELLDIVAYVNKK